MLMMMTTMTTTKQKLFLTSSSTSSTNGSEENRFSSNWGCCYSNIAIPMVQFPYQLRITDAYTIHLAQWLRIVCMCEFVCVRVPLCVKGTGDKQLKSPINAIRISLLSNIFMALLNSPPTRSFGSCRCFFDQKQKPFSNQFTFVLITWVSFCYLTLWCSTLLIYGNVYYSGDWRLEVLPDYRLFLWNFLQKAKTKRWWTISSNFFLFFVVKNSKVCLVFPADFFW